MQLEATAYDLGYKEGFEAGVEHYKKFTKSSFYNASAPPPAGPPGPDGDVLVSREETAKAVESFFTGTREGKARYWTATQTMNGIAALVRALPPHGTKE